MLRRAWVAGTVEEGDADASNDRAAYGGGTLRPPVQYPLTLIGFCSHCGESVRVILASISLPATISLAS